MTDRVNSITIALDRDIRIDDVEPLLNAMRMLKYVLKVEPNISSPTDFVAQQRAEHKYREKLFKALDDD